MHTTTIWRRLGSAPWRYLWGRGPWASLGYITVSAALGVVLVGLLVPTLLFLPLSGLCIGALERHRTRWLGFARLASPHVRVPRGSGHSWLHVRLGELATWREVGAVFVDLLLGIVSLVALSASVGAVALPVAIPVIWISRPEAVVNFWGDFTITSDSPWAWAVPLLGVVHLIVACYVWGLLAGGQASLLRPIVGPREAELERSVASLTRARATLVQAIEDERRRIERDLHDGVQQDLVALRARLALVSLEADVLADAGHDVSALRAASAQASADASRALDALRRTVRGLHPVVLSDHGLGAAVAELAERSPLPLLATVDERRPPAPIETAAYYLVTEGITNAAKHSTASRATLEAGWDGEAYVVRLADDGGGGADEARGTGIAGLRQRAESLGGELQVQNTPRGTVLGLRVPVLGGLDAAPVAQSPASGAATAGRDTHAHPAR